MNTKTIEMYIVCLLFPFFSLFAQDNLTTIDIPESKITIFSSKGAESTAMNLAQLMNKVNDYIASDITGFKADIHFKVYTPEDWSKFTFPGLIYGMPHFRDSNSIVVAAEDNGFWKSVMPDPASLPESLQDKYVKTYTREDGSLSGRGFFDLLSIHELGHLYQFQSDFTQQKYWLTEFYCNLFLHTAIAELSPEYLDVLEILPMIHASAPKDQLVYTTLDQFESDYRKMGLEAPHNYGWYQFRFHDAARKVYNEGGKEVLGKLWEFHLKHKEVLDRDQLVVLLRKEVHPAVAQFIEEW